MRFSAQAAAATIGATVALAAAGGGVATADDYAGGYRSCGSGQQVVIDVTWYGTLDVSFWTGSTDPHRHVHDEQTVGQTGRQFVPTDRASARDVASGSKTCPSGQQVSIVSSGTGAISHSWSEGPSTWAIRSTVSTAPGC